jgi:hypothetical protein
MVRFARDDNAGGAAGFRKRGGRDKVRSTQVTERLDETLEEEERAEEKLNQIALSEVDRNTLEVAD